MFSKTVLLRSFTKRALLLMMGGSLFLGCSTARMASNAARTINVSLDLVNVVNDKVTVTVTPPGLKGPSATYHFARIIPGTYAIADYGRYVENIRAFARNGKSLPVQRVDSNTVVIDNATQLGRLTYEVNDTFDSEANGDVFGSADTVIFSPAGTNILAGKQFYVNLSGFLGYFNGEQETPYRVTINHPSNLYGSTAALDTDPSDSRDLFLYSRYAEAVDNPLMYNVPDTAMFQVNGMDVLLSLYVPKKNTSASVFKTDLQRMVTAQKTFLGPINNTKKYAILAYLTTNSDGDAKGIGALEHNTSTSAVFRENMTMRDLTDVISHEFFHTITPLKIHSDEIRHFNFEQPKMSRHLWFYEGITEYFAKLFQVNQGLISEDVFFDLMNEKITAAEQYNDALSFTDMSLNVLNPEMKKQYPNVYAKGALIAMCLDIILRENSQGNKGILSLMGELTKKYGPDRAFDDETFISEITSMTYPEVGDFLSRHVAGNTPIDYLSYFRRMGVAEKTVPLPQPIVFIIDDQVYIGLNDKQQIIVAKPDDKNQFFRELDLKNGDVLVSMNGIPFNGEDGSAALMMGYGLIEDSPITLEIIRDGKNMTIKGKVKLNYADGPSYRFNDPAKSALKNTWLKG